MKHIWKHLYSFLVIPLLWLVLRTMGMFNSKIRRGIRGRVGLFESLRQRMQVLPPGKRVWFHSSSMGEFEQAKPIIAALKQRNPNVRVIASFFSPSGYEHSKKSAVADVITYLPFDTRRNARTFIDIIQPDAAVMVRYDVWPNHIWELERRSIPTLIANATMRRQTKRRIPIIRNFHHHMYNALTRILTVSPEDAEVFSTFGLDRPVIQSIGDTRYDQVSARSTEARKRHIMPRNIIENKHVIVAGSTWPEDEIVLLPAALELLNEIPGLLLILVPHEPTIEHIEDLERQLFGTTPSIRFSALNEYNNEPVIIVDSIGILLILYAYAEIAFIGGSFRQGIHNVLEAAVYGIPVIFGPRHRNSQEPLHLVERGGGFIVNDSSEMHRTLRNLLEDSSARTTAGGRAAQFVQSNVGATERFLQHLEPYLTGKNHKEAL
ncbi:MAG: kdtA [Bacteroidetes bacterium]|nr:kdtA [Bacteroidota bacterium]